MKLEVNIYMILDAETLGPIMDHGSAATIILCEDCADEYEEHNGQKCELEQIDKASDIHSCFECGRDVYGKTESDYWDEEWEEAE